MFESFNPEINGNLKCLSNIRVGGKADYVVRIESKDEFVRLSRMCGEVGQRIIPVGHGSNVFFSDGRVEGVVAVMLFSGMRISGANRVIVSSGVRLSDLLEFSFRNSLSGLELFTGIPGSVGGALYGNAGAYGSEIGSRLLRAEIMTSTGEIINVDNSYFRFGYRDSVLKRNRAVILEAELELTRGEESRIREKSAEIQALRDRKLPPVETLTVGSYFKNLCLASGERKAAAYYLDAVESKTCSVGDAFVYEGHANIICNRGNCSAEDILRLESILAERVKTRFGINLEREVMFIE